MLNKRGWGGPHLAVVRSWIQRKAINGETVTWGSNEFLKLRSVTAHDMDNLAQDIAEAVIKEIITELDGVCDTFAPWGPHPQRGGEYINYCNSCEQTLYLHELKEAYK